MACINIFDNVLELPSETKTNIKQQEWRVHLFFFKCHGIGDHLYLAEIAALDPINTLNK